ncbi:MAG: formylglycine-generating enzyme family protein [Nitrospina sp.]|nr:MAG: formylglycine-generating enzyme family protein [Nitrospina sp.]
MRLGQKTRRRLNHSRCFLWGVACLINCVFAWSAGAAPPIVLTADPSGAGPSGAGPPGEVIQIPAGKFTMGSGEADIQWAAKKFFSESLDYYRDETPAHTVYLNTYGIDKTEVTVDQYLKQLQATGNPSPKFLDHAKFNQPLQPVVGVTWQEAVRYCAVLGKRLPTEAEWEKAARGNEIRYYPWGNTPDETRGNVRGKKDGFRYTAPVGSFPGGTSPYGVLDMAGNVWEWTQDWYQPYAGNEHNNDFYGTQFKVLRGGSWFSNLDLARVAVRGKGLPGRAQNYIGFRCAQ